MTKTSEKIIRANMYLDTIEAVKNTLKTKFNIADNVPFTQYPDLIHPVAEDDFAFYKVASSYYDPAIPAHKNIQISGMSNPAGNGTWINQRPDYSGFTQAWVNGSYMLSFNAGYWYIYNKGATPSPYECYYRAMVVTSSESGDSSNPWIWDNYASSDKTITNAIDASNINYEYGYFYVTLKAGTAYKFGIMKNLTGGSLDYMSSCIMPTGDSWEELASGYHESTETINGHSCVCPMSFTPSTTGIYKFRVYGENYGAQGDIKYVCYPAPEAWVEPSENPWDYTFEVVNGSGNITMTPIEVAEHPATKTWAGYRVYKRTNADGAVYYDYADTITEGLAWTRFAPNSGEVWNADATLRVDYLDDGHKYPENATVWKIDVAANTTYYMGVAGGAGNIIDWGDGTTTTTKSGTAAMQNTWQIADANSRYTHTYTKAGSYIIQVVGDSVTHVFAETLSNYHTSNATYNVVEAIQCSKTMLNGRCMFAGSKNLKKIADTFQLPKGVESVEYMFENCSDLLSAPQSLRLPASCYNFDSFMSYCRKLKVDVSHWFDDLVVGSNVNKRMYRAFYACNAITGTLPAEKLWLDASWRNGSAVDTREAFAGCTKLSNYKDIAQTWINN